MNGTILKAASTLITNKDVRKFGAKLLLVVFSPLLLIILLFTSIGSAGSQHNMEVVNTLFEYKAIPITAPLEFKEYMETMQGYFRKIDQQAEVIQPQIKEGTFDVIQIKSLFLATYVSEQAPILSDEEIQKYVMCFIEELEIVEDEEQKKDGKEEAEIQKRYKVIHDLETIKNNVQEAMQISLTDEMMNNYQSIVSYVNPGSNAPTTGEGVPLSEAFAGIVEASNQKDYVGGEMGSPFDDGWEDKITSEFGSRSPITLPDGTVTSKEHTGMDFGAMRGTPILSINDGTVVYVRNHSIGLGLHLVVDHGGGILSVYGHTSRIIVKEGDEVKKGQKIAEVGATGYSTGNHLHLEIWENEQPKDPRNYLK